MRKVSLILVVFFGFAKTFLAQELKGKVVNEFNEPLENAYVYVTEQNLHTHTNQFGQFVLPSVNVLQQIQISILGYEKTTIVVSNEHLQNGIVITLQSKTYELEELVLKKEVNVLQTISKIDLNLNPVNNSQEILRKVPGLIIGQHAGGGKAEQIFLRGFDIDHGTDITLTVDGMPINMVSHAHGQGYSDLHFIIPETIEKIDFGKGPFYAHQGDFNTAGYVNFSTKNALQNNSIQTSIGDFNSLKTTALFNLVKKPSDNAYAAIEFIQFDGPFEVSQNFNRLNLFAKYNTYLNDDDKLTISSSYFTSRWDASGQIPQRAVDNGSITRFGAIDPTEGGFTSRTNINVQLQKKLNASTLLNTNAFYTNYNFELYSNFTFFLVDPVNGDQIRQLENRDIFGFNTHLKQVKNYQNLDATYAFGAGLRYDIIQNNELSYTRNRSETLQTLQLGDVHQNNLYAFFNSVIDFGKFEINPSLRLDYFKFMYANSLSSTYEILSTSKAIVNPKLNFLYRMQDNLQWFLKLGMGFHSNDARVILQQNADKILPRAYGVDFGNTWKPTPTTILNTTLWYLFSEEEFVYVGDAGIVEPSGKSERFGLEVGLRQQLFTNFYFDTDATFTRARSLENNRGEDFIPLAPNITVTGGLSFNKVNNFSGGFKYRFLADRPANEDNSIVAEGYFVADVNINYHLKNLTFGLAIDNIFNVDWNETQFATESRLQSEASSVEEIHFTPGTPRFAKLSITYNF